MATWKAALDNGHLYGAIKYGNFVHPLCYKTTNRYIYSATWYGLKSGGYVYLQVDVNASTGELENMYTNNSTYDWQPNANQVMTNSYYMPGGNATNVFDALYYVKLNYAANDHAVNKIQLKDTNNVVYDITVDTNGQLVATQVSNS